MAIRQLTVTLVIEYNPGIIPDGSKWACETLLAPVVTEEAVDKGIELISWRLDDGAVHTTGTNVF